MMRTDRFSWVELSRFEIVGFDWLIGASSLGLRKSHF